MKTVFATFNFKSTDLASAEKLYIENHVRLTLQLPNLRQYITGLVHPHPHRPSPHRAAFNYFDDATALRWALHKSPAAPARPWPVQLPISQSQNGPGGGLANIAPTAPASPATE